MKMTSFIKCLVAISLLTLSFDSAFAYKIKHGYSVANGMEYYGKCDTGEDVMVYEDFKSGESMYKGPKGEGKVKGSMDAAARKACGEDKDKKK